MNIRLALAFIISLVSCQVPAQVKPFNEENIEIGIVEKLESTIPMDLEFMLEDGSRVSLNEHIDKPTILSFVYFDCPGMCGPLLAGVADVITKQL